MEEEREASGPTRVFVVDDDPVTRALCAQALTSAGMAVREIEGGRQALEAVRSELPDLVILDLEMPGVDGYEVCSQLRAHPESRGLPVLILTGHTDTETIDRAFEVGATDFVHKPIDWHLFQHRVRFLMHAHAASIRLQRTLRELRESEGHLANAQRLARIGSWQWEQESDEMQWSDEVFRILGLGVGAVKPSRDALLEATHPEDRTDLERTLEEAAEEREPWRFEHRLLLTHGEERFVQQQAEIEVLEGVGPEERWRMSGTIQDVTERRRAEEQIRYLAHYDALTALPNRRMLNEHLSRITGNAEKTSEAIALLFLDLDRFKQINDTLGHAIGDALLKAVAGRLIGCVRTIDQVSRPTSAPRATVSRLGGDEFTVVLREQTSPRGAARVARRILESMHEPFVLEGHRVDVAASIGIALFPGDGTDPDSLLRNADAAMYRAKEEGGDLYRYFSQSHDERAKKNLRLEGGLRRALEEDELLLHYQPQLDARTGRAVAVEALLRWRSPELGLLPAGDFISLAEDSGLILPVGERVFREACAQSRAWREAGLPDLRLAINVSSVQMRKGGLVESVAQALHETGLEPTLLELEFTERALLGPDDGVEATLNQLHEMGVRLALDDFGTGESSLSRLAELPLDILKIDRSLVGRIGTGGPADAVTAALVALARRLGLTVVGEGVESEEQERFLRQEGCDRLQGFRFGRPLDAEALGEHLSGRR